MEERERERETGSAEVARDAVDSREDHPAMHINSTINSEHDSIIQLTMDN